MRKIKTGIIGAGAVGHFHAKHFAQLPQSEFVGVVSRDYEKAKSFASEYGVSAFPSVEIMRRETGVEAVSICSPHPAHRENAVNAARAGVHILVEKPLADSLSACDDILAAAAHSGVKVGSVCQRRFYAPCLRIKKAIDDGKLGRPILGTIKMLGWRDRKYYESAIWRGTWSGEGGGVLINQAPHQMDLLLWYMGEIDEVFALWENLNHPYIEVEDTAAAIIRFKSGAIGNILVTNSANPALYGKVSVFGENGAGVGVQTDGGAMFVAGQSSVTEPPFNDLWTIPGEEHLLEEWRREDEAFFASIDPTSYYHGLQIADFLDAIIEGRKPLSDGLAGRRTVELFSAIYRSGRTRMPVKFPLSAHDGGDYDGRLS
ncbi:MAG: Gfo/Idh/MocA family protein [Christensenellales bacterium]|jgi:UDP-N-acetyl-2-amino-2-deoxyglucuronate dehydrogenase